MPKSDYIRGIWNAPIREIIYGELVPILLQAETEITMPNLYMEINMGLEYKAQQ